MKEIIFNIFRNKTYFSALLLTIILLFLIVIFKNSIFIPLFKKDLINNTLGEATKISKHLSRTINFDKSSYLNIDPEIQTILKEFKIDTLHYYSIDGKILYSTNKNKIGKHITGDYFINEVAKGKIYSDVKYIQDENINSVASILVEIYVPIIERDNFKGGFEFYYNITNKMNIFNNNVKKVNLYMFVFNMIFLIIIFSLLYIASKNNLKDKKYQNELKNFRNIINETKAYVFIKDLNGCYTFANQLVLDLFKISQNDLIGKDDSYFFDLDISNELKKNDEFVMKSGQSIEKEESNIIKETGELKIYWSVKRPLYDKNENLIGIAGISTDITSRKMLEREIKEQKDLLNIILDNVDAYIYIKDTNRNFLYVNANTAELFRKPQEEIIGCKDIDVLPKEMADIFWESDKDVFLKNKKVSTEETIVDPNGQVKHYWSTKLPYTYNNENVLIGFSSDITEVHLLKEKLKKESITDSLTNLYNKRHFETIAESEYKRSIRRKLDMSIIIFDIDYFKKINDTYGHYIGDKILEEASKVFKSQIRKEDTLCRVGGEEFTIILPHTNTTAAVELAERIRVSIEKRIFKFDEVEDIFITLSFGVSSLTISDKKFEDILLNADKALYKAKETGRNKVVVI